ncbi:helix-turn-helix transcriptional regulator [Achromobacter veterisilvae]|uniref:Helix-turn-helix transcriptional regulator n=1 Tax=Achromobacter veterisilvae TaxID=2069367 RepID=A0ABZ2S7E1_9BURK|nr:helix-turn-helix transcriptional regulator [Achromobacter veterisilvae]
MRKMRLRLGWTQKDLALASGLTQSAIGNYESGQRVEPSGQALVGLAQALKVSPGWLSHGDEGPGADGATARKASRNPLDSSPVRWPFREVSLEEYLSLSASEKKILSSMVATYIQACQHKR